MAKGNRWDQCKCCGSNRNDIKHFVYFPRVIRDKVDGIYHIKCGTCRTMVQQVWHNMRRPTLRGAICPRECVPMHENYKLLDKLYKTNPKKWYRLQQYLKVKSIQGSMWWSVVEVTRFSQLLKQPPKRLILKPSRPIPAPRRPTPAPRKLKPRMPRSITNGYVECKTSP